MTSIKRLLIICFFAITFLGCTSPTEKTQAYLTKGIDYYKQGDNNKARIELKNAIQIDAKKADAYYYLALIDEKEQNWPSLFNNLKQTIALDPKNNDAHLKLGQLLLLTSKNDFSKVTEQIDAILANSANNADALTLKASVLFKQEKSDEAIALLDTIEHNDFIPALTLKAAIYISRKDTATALSIIDKALLTKPDELSLSLLKLQIHVQAKNSAAIEQDYAELIKRFPDKLEFNYSLARYYADNKQEDKAVKVLQDTIQNNATQVMPKLVFIDYLVSKNSKEVEATLKTYLTQHTNDPDLLFRLANFYLQEKKYPEAKEQLNIIVAEKKDSKEALNAKLLLAKISLLEDKDSQEKATTLIKEILAANPVHFDALMLQAKISLNKALYDEAISQFRNILTNYPKSDEALVLLAKAYIQQQSPELAEENLHKALNVNPNNLNALMPILNKLVQAKDFVRATELVEKGLIVKPDDLELLKILAQIKLFAGDWGKVQQIADTIARQPDGLVFSNYLKGRVLQGQQRHAEAVIKFKEALANNPEFLEALQGVIQSNEALNQRSATFNYLNSHMVANPDKQILSILKAQLLIEDKRPNEAIITLTNAINNSPKSPQLYAELAKIYLQSKNIEQAVAVYNKALENMPGNADFKMALAAVYEQKGDYDNALKIYEELLIKQPDSDILANNIASLLLDHKATQENIERAVKLAARFEKSKQPYLLDTYAWSLLNTGLYDEAVQVLQKVIAITKDVPVFRYHLAVAYHKTAHDIVAANELEQALLLGEKTGGFVEKQKAEELLKEIKATRH